MRPTYAIRKSRPARSMPLAREAPFTCAIVEPEAALCEDAALACIFADS
jgi:hypothetical protein